MRLGVFLGNVLGRSRIDPKEVAAYAASLPGVVRVRVLGPKATLAPESLADEIKAEGLDRIVLAGDSPGDLRPAFARALQLAGRDPEEVRLASFQGNGASGTDGLEHAKAALACAVHGVPFSLAAAATAPTVNPATLVVGGGVAGIQAALEIAEAGAKAYLVERTATIGGHMAMFDKTFPTLDCAACILTPKMVSVGESDRIELITNAEVQAVEGGPGAYRVKVQKRARRVDAAACIACNACSEICPVTTPSEFDSGLARRKAIFIPFPQAVPNAYVVDPASCTWVQSQGKKCGACLKKCPKGCIHLDQEDEVVEIEVGSIILAVGYDLYDPRRLEGYGYGKLPNVITSLEFERMTNASGPTGGKVVLKTRTLNKRTKTEEWTADPSGPSPKRVAILHCVGSRDANHNPYCSRVCCMYSLKFAHLVHEKLPEATCHELYIDMRAFGKGYEEFMERVKAEGVHLVRGRAAAVREVAGQMMIEAKDVAHNAVLDLPVDMVILSLGVVPAAGSAELADRLGIPRDANGWLSETDPSGDPIRTGRGGVFIAGMCQGPRDIPDTVAQASAAAGAALVGIASGRSGRDLGQRGLGDVESRAIELEAQVQAAR